MSGEGLGVGIVGCGLIGRKRAANLGAAQLVACADVDEARALDLAATAGDVRVSTDWRDLVSSADVDIVIVCTTNQHLAEISAAAAGEGKHVLVEKPAAMNRDELEMVLQASASGGGLVRIGFNHRYHPAMQKAREIFEAGALGRMMFVRGRYGHGGRLGYEKEWRADPKISGGGELLDQGVHLIDLSRWFLGDFVDVSGKLDTCYWDMPVEDNAFMTLGTEAGATAFLHVTWTEWKNMFSMEIYGTDAKLQIDGLGGSYGEERLTYYRMLPEMGPPETESWNYPGGDDSWSLEFDTFLADIREGRQPVPGLVDAMAVLGVTDALYDQNPRYRAGGGRLSE
jgi:predicted dehydrogenase